ncbi:PREDICTED: uncharacterized protein LOC106744059 [Dinoponera quadriceps]|uniref:Uncharacterized protein LOC106744059 n=1 Tax=Dinoponera quadriceps TaxID=609295 RepID=A0A6P3X6M5_DINQU|nr:PREDICTED: uncharacterized protein LOC106744059 [Dinoponera quadriceps]
MRPDSRSVSFTFHREVLAAQHSPIVARAIVRPLVARNSRNLRQRLQDQFDQAGEKKKSKEKPVKKDASTNTDRGWNNLSLSNVSADSRKAFRSGAEKLSRTISSMRTTFGTISQRFKCSTRRRHRLEEQHSPGSKMQTPQTRSRQLLGRTPTKLYSPFGIESPRHGSDKENDATPVHASSECNARYLQCRPFRFAKGKGFSVLR